MAQPSHLFSLILSDFHRKFGLFNILSVAALTLSFSSSRSPYTNEHMQNIDVCFVDIKRFPVSDSDAALLKLHKIPVCPQMFLSSYLTEAERPRAEDSCLPEFAIK